MSETVILGLSGGVDSSVAAELLRREGLDVRGLYLDIGQPGGAEAARAAADYSAIPLRVLDIRRELEEQVCRPFARAYLRGETPNPCVMCNPRVKFRALTDYADSLGAKYIATGHYARAEGGLLKRGLPRNDQSYMLCRLTREQVARLLLPLGGYEKAQVRALAADMNLPAAKKADSMEICFIPDNDYGRWLEARGEALPVGDFVYDGRVVGRHRGLHRYTIGQRKHFGLSVGKRVYVSGLDFEHNRVLLSDGDELFVSAVTAGDMSWLTEPPGGAFRCSVKVRHSRSENPLCTVTPRPGGDIAIVTDTPVRAPTPGQAAVLYDGDTLLGGGIIR